MIRTTWAVLAGLLLVVGAAGQQGPEGPAGNWKLTFTGENKEGEKIPNTLWLVKLELKDKKWTGSVLNTREGVPATTLENLKVTGDRVQFTLRLANKQELSFEGQVPKEANKKILGSLLLGSQLVVAELSPTKITSFDSFELNKDILAHSTDGPELFDAVIELLGMAADKKVKPEEVRGWAAKALKAADPYGPRWKRELAVRIAQVLTKQEGFAPVALQFIRQAERQLEPTDSITDQLRVLQILSAALKQSAKPDEDKEVDARIDKIMEKLVKVEPFAGRKGKNDRAVLVELFTGAQCPPCVAADLAFDAVAKTYKPTDVVLLQYHLHIPGPDPLTNADTEKRAEFYDDDLGGTPTVFFNGKPNSGATGGALTNAEDRYQGFCKAINPLLETPAAVKLKATAKRSGDKIDIAAEASNVEEPGEKMRLRLVLTEEKVRYQGSNNMRYHHHVVRAFPGGPEGVALKEKNGKHSATVNLAELRKALTKYLDTTAKKQPFPNNDRPLDLKKLRVVAFVQNDKTKEVLQAVQVPVAAE